MFCRGDVMSRSAHGLACLRFSFPSFLSFGSGPTPECCRKLMIPLVPLEVRTSSNRIRQAASSCQSCKRVLSSPSSYVDLQFNQSTFTSGRSSPITFCNQSLAILITLLRREPHITTFAASHPVSTMAQQFRELDTVKLNAQEERIFDTLKQTLAHFGMKTQLRVAGGWVRDKVSTCSDQVHRLLDVPGCMSL
jgi:hypothetical protein